MTIVEAIVKPGSRRPGIARENGVLVVRVCERAIEGAANEACIRAIAEAFGVAQSAVELISGKRARRKRFAIRAKQGCRFDPRP